jgi:AcrR family transcriptional regulator
MPKKSRNDWLRAGLRQLARVGIDGVRVEPLAQEMGVTKGSFYWHFSDRAELLDAMLDEWAETATEAVIAQAETAGSGPHARLERLTTIATEGFDAELELALRDWGRRDSAVAAVLDEVDGRRMEYLRKLLRESGFEAAEAEARAFLLYSALLGDHLLPRSHGRFSRKRVLRMAFELLASHSRHS